MRRVYRAGPTTANEFAGVDDETADLPVEAYAGHAEDVRRTQRRLPECRPPVMC